MCFFSKLDSSYVLFFKVDSRKHKLKGGVAKMRASNIFTPASSISRERVGKTKDKFFDVWVWLEDLFSSWGRKTGKHHETWLPTDINALQMTSNITTHYSKKSNFCPKIRFWQNLIFCIFEFSLQNWKIFWNISV